MNRKVLISLLAGFLLLHFLPVAMPSYAKSIEDLKKGVVRITAKEQGKTTVGAGFIVNLGNEQAYILTAAHVVGLDPHPQVEFFTNRNVPVRATVIDKEGEEATSLAVLVVQGKEHLPSGLNQLAIDYGTPLSGGEDIVTIGFPAGAGPWTILKGAIGSRKGSNLVIDINIDEGSSGGPLILNGSIVGLMAESTRYGFAVPAEVFRKYLVKVGLKNKDEIAGKDGAPMVLVPAGEFWMGTPDGEGNKDEHPRHRVHVDAFYIDQYEVTTARYARFFQETNQDAPKYWSDRVPKQHAHKPVVGVHWGDATDYCAWAGKRLPTEAEWEKASRGTDERRYPWGNEPPSEQRANFHKTEFQNYGVLTDVGSFEEGKSSSSVYDMAGNVGEWVADGYDENYYSKSPVRNPKGPPTEVFGVVRGGSWGNRPYGIRSAFRNRNLSTNRNDDVGFRCAQDVPK
ncbi:MAG: SUMF1/EgtB/PvdO family nonheme iron enzyme [Nitrospira sp.]|nr:SUMF1/EgtB/PvdO family nonheme iron enzyme [Nitrospira sp.]